MGFNLDDYEPVASRVQRFYAAHPNGAIHTEIVHDDGTRIVIKASVWRDQTDPMPAGVDYAEEMLADRGVNADSRIENCATSAIGRAISIAAAGLGPSDWTKKPSREEMQKVQRRETVRQGDVTVERPANLASDKQKNMIRAMVKKLGRTVPANLDVMTKYDASQYIDRLKQLENGGRNELDTLDRQGLDRAQEVDQLEQDEEPF